MAQSDSGGTIASAREYEQYNSDEAFVTGATYAKALSFDCMNIRESVVQITNKGTDPVTYKIFASSKKGQSLSAVDPQTDDSWINLLSSGTYDHTTETTIPTSVAATGTITLSSAVATNTVTINGLTYTAVAGAKADNTEFSIDVSDTAAATDLADSITNDTRTGTDVPTIDQTATSNVGVVTVTATVTGALGNSITMSENTGDTTISLSGATLTGGADPRAYESFSNPWRYVIVMLKATSGTPTVKVWHRGEN